LIVNAIAFRQVQSTSDILTD